MTIHNRHQRTLALLDIENRVAGDPARAAEHDYVHAAALAAAAAGLDRASQVVVGVGSSNLTGIFAMRSAWPAVALRCRRGENGADRALGAQLDDLEAVSRSYDRVVIGSGDHFFVDHVVALNEYGLHTVAVAWANKLNGRLRMAAAEVRVLDAALDTTKEADRAA
jgi:hypothetical protein